MDVDVEGRGAMSEMPNASMRAGAGRALIDLPEGLLPFDGFGAQTEVAPLYARSLVFEDATGTRFAVCSVEATSLRDPLLTELREGIVREAGVPLAAAWACVTHSFSIPHVRTEAHLESEGDLERNRLWRKAIVRAVVQSVRDAMASLRPAVLSLGEADCPVNTCRDVETAAGWWLGAGDSSRSDRRVRVLAAHDAGGALVALLSSMDVQSSMLDGVRGADGGKLISGDLAGMACQQVERRMAGESHAAQGQLPVCLFAVGAAGDQAPVERVADGTDPERAFAAVDDLAGVLAQGILDAAETATPVPAANIQLGALNAMLPGQEIPQDRLAIKPCRAYDRAPAADRTTQVDIALVGDIELVGLRPEISSAMAVDLRHQADAPRAFVLTMVNGGQKYLVESESYDRNTYESMNSMFAKGAGEQLMRETAQTLRILRSAHVVVDGAPDVSSEFQSSISFSSISASVDSQRGDR